MDHTVHLKELRQNMTKYADRVSQGDSFVVMKHSRPLFKISQVNEDGWETVIDFTRFKKSGISAAELLKKLKAFSRSKRILPGYF